MKVRKILVLCIAALLMLALAITLAACDGEKDVDVSFTGISANGESETVTTTAITLTFDKDVTNLAASNITVTGATKGALTGTGTTRTLAISNITVEDGDNITVAISNPTGFKITPASKTVAVYVEEEAVVEPLTLADFLAGISDIQGNFVITGGNGLSDCIWEVNGSVSVCYNGDADKDEYMQIIDEDTYYGYTTDGISWTGDFEIAYPEEHVNILIDYFCFNVFFGDLISDADFGPAVDDVYTLTLASVSLPGGYMLTSLSIEYLGGASFEVTQVIDSVTYVFEITFGTATVSEDDILAIS